MTAVMVHFSVPDRNPFFLFGQASLLLFLVLYRFPKKYMTDREQKVILYIFTFHDPLNGLRPITATMEISLSASGTRNSSAGKQHEMSTLMLLLVSRMLLFLLFQAIVALILRSWSSSEGYWLLTATLTNIVSISLLVVLFRKERESYLGLFRFRRDTLKKDILIFLGLTLLCGPVVFGPNYLLSDWLWSDPEIPFRMMFRPIDRWLAIMLAATFPVTIAFAELATYFGYIMPRLRSGFRSGLPALLMPVLFLSLQHMTMPFIPDLTFILYRAVVFLPFALLIGIAIYRRPSLFPYFAILHGIMDLGTAIMFLTF